MLRHICCLCFLLTAKVVNATTRADAETCDKAKPQRQMLQVAANIEMTRSSVSQLTTPKSEERSSFKVSFDSQMSKFNMSSSTCYRTCGDQVPDADTVVNDATFDEAGYAKVALLCCLDKMKAYVKRLMANEGIEVCCEGCFSGMAMYFDCLSDRQSYASLHEQILKGLPGGGGQCQWLAKTNEACPATDTCTHYPGPDLDKDGSPDPPGPCGAEEDFDPDEMHLKTRRDTYAMGKPGVMWSKAMMRKMRAKIVRVIQEGFEILNEAGIPSEIEGNEAWTDMPSAAKLLRLSFHDCLKYTDGSGGCDGCLQWTPMDLRHDRNDLSKMAMPDSLALGDGHNNGLHPTVKVLELLWTQPDFPQRTPMMRKSLRDYGVSRADLWAFAGMVAVEYSIDLNNYACDHPNNPVPQWGTRLYKQCHPRWGESDCHIQQPRDFTMHFGRKDCTPDGNHGPEYLTRKEEVHPNPAANGAETATWFQNSFGFSKRETIAISGAHTLGRPHVIISLHAYNWKTGSEKLFNNGYFRNLAKKVDWFYPTGRNIDDARFRDYSCLGLGDGKGGRPVAMWQPRAIRNTASGGPVQWFNKKWVCNCFDAYYLDQSNKGLLKADDGSPCCSADGSDWHTACKPGCHRWFHISGHDETMLNSDIGLYYEFDSSKTTGVPSGCANMDNFNPQTWGSIPNGNFKWQFAENINCTDVGGQPGQLDTANVACTPAGSELQPAEPQCPPNNVKDVNDEPMHKIVEEYADDVNGNVNFLRDFFPTYEKMLKNGYSTADLPSSQQSTFVCPPVVETWRTDRWYECH